MKRILSATLAGLFALSIAGGAAASCGAHSVKTAEGSGPVSTAEAPIVTPKPKTDG